MTTQPMSQDQKPVQLIYEMSPDHEGFVVLRDGKFFAQTDTEAQAKEIVLAVNCYAALVDALHRLAAASDDTGQLPGTIEYARAALALVARGGTPE